MTRKILIPVVAVAVLGAIALTTCAEAPEPVEPIAETIEAPLEPIQETFEEPIEIIEPIAEQAQMEPTGDQNELQSRWTDDDKLMIAKMTMAEAEGESLEGKCLVARVILNRVESETFPDTVLGVISQQSQFSSWTNGRYENAVPSDEVWQAVQMVCDDGWDESEGALFFEATWCENTWQSNNRVYLYTVGGHKFYL